jgi:hypothetical protein
MARPAEQHRVMAQLALRAYWLRHVLRVAEDCWRSGQGLHLYPPNAAEIDEVAKVLASYEPTTELALAGDAKETL